LIQQNFYISLKRQNHVNTGNRLEKLLRKQSNLHLKKTKQNPFYCQILKNTNFTTKSITKQSKSHLLLNPLVVSLHLLHLGLVTLAMIVTRPDERLQKLCWGYFAFSRTRLKWLHDNLQIDKGLRFEGKIAQAVHYLKRQNRHCFFDGPGTGQNLGGFTGTGWIAGLLWWVWIGPSHNNASTWHLYLVYILVLVRGLWSRNSNFGLQLQASRCFGSSSNL